MRPAALLALPAVRARAGLQLFVSAAGSLSALDWVGWGKPEAANQRLGLEKCLEGWTFSLETLAHLERTSRPAQRPSPPGLPPSLTTTPYRLASPIPGHLDLVVPASPRLPGYFCSLHVHRHTRAHRTHPAAPSRDSPTQLTDS